MAYELKGSMVEICTCKSLCPCVAGLDPDGGECRFSWVFQFDEGSVDGTDVSGLRFAVLGHLVGSASDGTVRAALFVDERASDAQEAGIMAAFTGSLGGPLADLSSLIGEVVDTRRVAIEMDVQEGTGTFRTGDLVSGRVEVHRGPDGSPTTMRDFALAPLGDTLYAGLAKDVQLDTGDLDFDFTPDSGSHFAFHHVVA